MNVFIMSGFSTFLAVTNFFVYVFFITHFYIVGSIFFNEMPDIFQWFRNA